MSININEIKHPLQPDWVVTRDDVDKFLAELDERKSGMEDRREYCPPYICYVLNDENGEEKLSILFSRWYGEYDPSLPDGSPWPVIIPVGNLGIS